MIGKPKKLIRKILICYSLLKISPKSPTLQASRNTTIHVEKGLMKEMNPMAIVMKTHVNLIFFR